jgi:acetyl-CoA carboxylase carboxyl transferase subunit alpha
MSKPEHKFTLDFEKPLVSLLQQIHTIEQADHEKYQPILSKLKQQLYELREQVYKNLEPHQKLQIARHPDRPYPLDYVEALGSSWLEMHGDRAGSDDAAIVGGLLELDEGRPIMLVGTEKGRNIRDKQRRNFGMPQPSGYRKALRLFRHAHAFGLPIVTLIDTPGAYPGVEAEAYGQSHAIAENLKAMFDLGVPVLSIITGEGGSGGALGLAVANRVLMLEHSVYSVISPEGCAAILWRTREASAKAAKALRITAPELKKLGLVDDIVTEAAGAAHNDKEGTAHNLRQALLTHLQELERSSPTELREERKRKFRNYGAFLE